MVELGKEGMSWTLSTHISPLILFDRTLVAVFAYIWLCYVASQFHYKANFQRCIAKMFQLKHLVWHCLLGWRCRICQGLCWVPYVLPMGGLVDWEGIQPPKLENKVIKDGDTWCLIHIVFSAFGNTPSCTGQKHTFVFNVWLLPKDHLVTISGWFAGLVNLG